MNERQLRGAGLLVVSFLAVAFLVGAVWRTTAVGGYGSLAVDTASEGVASAKTVRRIVIPAGWRAEQVAGALQKAGISDGDRFLEEVRRRSLEGYLSPGVYDVESDFSEEELVDEMVERFRKTVTPATRRRARAVGLSLREIVTLASIVQREMLRPSDAPAISAVFHNRLKIGMPLRSNPTIIFARESARGPIDGQYWRSRLDVRIDSPYNTYARTGLPPGPIASPSDDAITAALWPADVEHLFFVARGNGSNDFAFTERAHIANVKRYERGLPAPQGESELQRFAERLAPPGGHVGLVVKHLVTGETASVNADDFFTSASLYKLAVMLKAFEDRERGTLNFRDRLPISERTGDLDTADVRARLGRAPSIAKAIREMIVVSSNAAGVTLLRKLGRDDIDRSLRRYGMRHTSVSSLRMVTTPRDVARLLELVATGRAVSKRASAEMVRILLRQEIRNRLPVYLPESARLAHKTGDLDRLSHDAGILYLRRGPVVIVAMTEEANRAQANEAIGLLGRFVYDYYEAYRPNRRRPLLTRRMGVASAGRPGAEAPTPATGCPALFAARRTGPLTGKTIFLDPGHGGHDPGARFRFRDGFLLTEKAVVLDITRRLRDLLTARGATVHMSRCRDVFIPLKSRAALANAVNPDLVVSVHVNGNTNPRKDGTEIYFFHPEGEGLANAMLGTFAKPALWETLSRQLALPNFGVFRRPLDVLTFSLAPTVLTESVYLTNPAEAAELRKTGRTLVTRRQQIANGHMQGILNYLVGGDAYEGVQRFGPSPRRQPPPSAEVRVVATGDIAIVNSPSVSRESLRTRISRLDADALLGEDEDPQSLLAGIGGHLAGDVVLGNLEGVLGHGGKSKCAGRESSSCRAFRAAPRLAHQLRRAGFTVLNLANNHSADYGAAGSAQTVEALDRAGLVHTGRPGQVARQRVGPARVAVIGFGHSAGLQSVLDIATAKRLVEQADTWADVVVVNMHAGGEGEEWMHVAPGPEVYRGEQRGDPVSFAHEVVDSGADLVVGHGPHVVRGMEWYRGRLIAYSLGNFAAQQSLSLRGPMGVGAILQARLGSDGSWRGGRLVSAQLEDGRTSVDRSGAAAGLIRRLSRADFGSSAVELSSAGEIGPPQGPAAPPTDGRVSRSIACTRTPSEVCSSGAVDGPKLIALSFDDGPSLRTEPLLGLLRRYRARATFFVTGEAVRGREGVLDRIAAEGHEIGNHTFSHPYTPELSESELRTELARTSELIRTTAGVKPRILRPPYGADAPRVARIGAELGLSPTVLWSIDPEDWKNRPTDEIVEQVVSEAEPGAIVLMHDGPDARKTIEALPRILAVLQGRGFRFVTVSEVLRGHAPAPSSSLRSEVAKLSPREKAALLVVSGPPVPEDAGGVLVKQWSRHLRPGAAIVFADQEGGLVRSFPELPPRRPASWYRRARVAFAAGKASGAALRRVGVHVDLAPVLDSSDGPLGQRHFRDPSFGLAFARGLAAGGTDACPKHFPGLGSTAVSTDKALVRGRVRPDELESFRAAIQAGTSCVMVGHAVYQSLGRRPASLEPATYRLLRSTGFDGVVITDDLDVLGRAQAGRWATSAVKAGADLALFTSGRDAARAIEALVPLARRGSLDDKVERVLRLRRAHGL